MGSADAVLTEVDGLLPGAVELGASEPLATEAPSRAASHRRRGLLTALAVVADLVAVASGYLLSDTLAVEMGHRLSGHVAVGMYATVLLWPLAFAAYGLYDRRRLVAPSEEARRLFHGVMVGTVAVITMTAFFRLEPSRLWMALLFVSTLGATGFTRLAVRRATRYLQARNLVGERVLVVGTNDEARALARTLARKQWLGYAPVGFAETSAGTVTDLVDSLPVTGSTDDIAEAVLKADATSVIIAGTSLAPGELAPLCARLQALEVDVRVSAGLGQVAASRVRIEPLDGVAVLSVKRNQLTRGQSAVKRTVDIVCSVSLLIATAPIVAVLALLVRLTSRGPAVFRQTRVGEGGKPFTIFKLRTMRTDAEACLVDLRDQNEADGVLFKIRHDPRITPLGRILRPLGLDELPQLWNVLRGEMSLVGPRPPLPTETQRYDQWVAGRLKVKPGITGLWQVNGRHELSFADYVRYDLFYVENWSLTLDLYVIAKTLPALLSRRGAS